MDFANVVVSLGIPIAVRASTMSLKTRMHLLRFLGVMEFLLALRKLARVIAM
jgi:hypothetical protein